MNKYHKAALISGAIAIIAVPAITFAHGINLGKFHKPVAMGTVASINGSTITLTGKSTTYTIDASNAKINKITTANGSKPTTSSITVSGIQTGDTIMVLGTASGSNISATEITDGTFGWNNNSRPGRGRAVTGTVASVSSNTITVAGKNNVSYFVDISNATIKKYAAGLNGNPGTQANITASQIQVGDKVAVIGSISGTNIKATQIIDGQLLLGNFHGHKNPMVTK